MAAWRLPGEGDVFAGERGRPCVVMAHGIGGTRDSGLLPFAEALAGGGLDVLLFDYRGFGDSSGEPRQYASPGRHREDYAAAVAYARGLDGVDPDLIVLWGTSWSGGHVAYVAADDPRIAAVIAQTPDMDGLRTTLQIARHSGVGQVARNSWHGLRDLVGAGRGRRPHRSAIVAPKGPPAALSGEEAERGYASIAGPSWRNEIAARALLDEPLHRPITRVGELSCPILIQIAERDSICPPAAARAAAWRAKGRSEVREYPCGHFEIYHGRWRERAIADQLHFLRHHLAA